jgi:hypothetical protein
MFSFSQPNDVVYRVRLDAAARRPPLLDRFAGGLGPFAGVVARPLRRPAATMSR